MPAMGAALSDEDLAAALTYMRQSWGNKASEITPEMVKAVRAQLGNRSQPSAEFTDRMPHVLAWLREAFAIARRDDIPALVVTGPQADRLRHGQTIRVSLAGPLPGEGELVVKAGGKAVGIAERIADEVRPLRLFNH